MPAPRLPVSATSGQIAEVLGITERTVNARKADGKLPSTPDGSVDLWAVIRAGVEALERRQRGLGDDDLDLNAERARLAKAQADAAEMKNEVTRSELIPRGDVVAGIETAFGHARARLLSIPAKAAPLVIGLERPAEVREILQELVNECCGELAATVAMPRPSDRPVDGGSSDGGDEGVDAAAEADREPMGRRRAGVVGRGKRRAG